MTQAPVSGAMTDVPIMAEELHERLPVYIGWRQLSDAEDVEQNPSVWFVDRDPCAVRCVAHVVLHSPSGIEWGYGGSGPADCALSILTDYLTICLGQIYGDAADAPSGCQVDAGRAAMDLHQAFKWRFVCDFEHERWILAVSDLRAWLRHMSGDLLTQCETRDFVRLLLDLTEKE